MTVYSLSGGKMTPIKQWNNVQIGTVLHMNGYECDDYVIIKNTGHMYETINLRTFERIMRGYSLKHISEKQANNGIQVYVTDRVMDPEAIMDVIDSNKAYNIKKEAEKVQLIKDDEAATKQLLKDYSHLDTFEGYTGLKTGAKNLKRELRTAFPGVKFSVRSSSYSMGCSIDVQYPHEFPKESIEQLEGIYNKYQYGYFNGMEDIYEYSKNLFTNLFGGAKYVHAQREWKGE